MYRNIYIYIEYAIYIYLLYIILIIIFIIDYIYYCSLVVAYKYHVCRICRS